MGFLVEAGYDSSGFIMGGEVLIRERRVFRDIKGRNWVRILGSRLEL